MVTGTARTCGGPPRGNEGALATTVRRTVLTLPAAPRGPENPLPPLRTPARLAVAAEESGRPDHAAQLCAEAFADLDAPGATDLTASAEGGVLLVALARAIFDAGFEVADLREGAGVLGGLWAQTGDEPLPDAYDFRMSPPEE